MTEREHSEPTPTPTPSITETPAIAAKPESTGPLAELLKVECFKAKLRGDDTAPEAETVEGTPWSVRLRRHAPLAASLAVAALLGGIAGAAATSAFASKPEPVVTAPAASDDVRALRETMVRLSTELTTLKAGLDQAHRSTASQINKLADRFDKAQAEPAARLAKLADSVDRLEKRPTVAAAAPAPETTGSVSVVEKQQSKPTVAEGWKLLEFYGGRAVVESRAGGLYEVRAGSSLPGLGKVETIRREDGKVVVVTPKGIIVSALEPPRRPNYYRY